MYRAALFLVLLFPCVVSAQSTILAESFELEVRGQSAGPGDRITLVVTSDTLDTSTFSFVWEKDGAVALEGEGASSYTLTLGPVGTQHTIRASVLEDTTRIATLETTVGPALVDIVWEGSGYAHPFYTGRVFPTPGATLRAQALALFPGEGGAPLAKNAIQFVWKYNERVVKNGIGADTVTISSPSFFEEGVLSVEAISTDGSFYATHKVRTPSIAPEFVLYPVHPLTGISFTNGYTRAVSVNDTEYSFTLYPFFAPISDLFDSSVSIIWSLDDAPAESDTGQPFRTTIVAPQTGIHTTLQARIQYAQDAFLNTLRRWDIGFSDVTATEATDVFARPTQ